MSRAFFLANLLASLVVFAAIAHAEPTMIEQVIVGEAANQGYDGLYAVGCVLRNRRWRINGFSASKRKDLYAFYLRQPAQVKRWATEIVARLHHDGVDTTDGASHFENVRAFGLPKWARSMRITARIGDQVFFSER